MDTRLQKGLLLALIIGASAATQATDFSGGSAGVSATATPDNAIKINLITPAGGQIRSETLSAYSNSGFADGLYKYELLGTLSALPTSRQNNLDNGRNGATATNTAVGVIENGHFRISDGVILSNSGAQER